MAGMTLERIRALIPVPDSDFVPPPGLFLHRSVLHGQAHVARVLVHGLRLLDAIDAHDEVSRLWAAVYLHDIARLHDGKSRRHGEDAWARLAKLPYVRRLFAKGGVREADYPAIEAAVTMHSAGELSPGDLHYRLSAVLKDADALDRVRLGDLNPEFLRHDEARPMVAFAQRLYDETNRQLAVGDNYFGRLWADVKRILAE